MDVDTAASQPGPPEAPSLAQSVALHCAVAVGLIGGLLWFYDAVYSIHTDLAGGALSGQLAVTLGSAFDSYSSYFPPAERAWFALAARLSDITGLRLDLAVMVMTGGAVMVSASLAYHVRRCTNGASPLFLIVSVAVLTLLPIAFKNVFGLREHLVILGLWPYLVLRVSDPDDTQVGWRWRLAIGLWLGVMLLMKYLYSLTVLLVELADAALQRRPLALFRIENLIAGGTVALYLFLWLVIDPEQRAVIGVMVNAIDANLASHWAIARQAAIAFVLAVFMVVLARLYRLPARETAIGLALVVSAIAVAWIQARWYSHHLFPVTVAYVAWWWMVRRDLRLLWQVAVLLVIARPAVGEFLHTGNYQQSVTAVENAMAAGGISVAGKRVGVLTMHPSPFNQYLAMHGAERWITSVNNAYVASELQVVDLPENDGKIAPPVKLEDPGIRMLHDEMLLLWEERPPEALILDESTSWPLRHIKVEWGAVFANDPRFQAILAQYRPVYTYTNANEELDFTYYVRR